MQILTGMELSLIREQRRAARRKRKRNGIGETGVETGLARGDGFVLQLGDVLSFLGVEIAGNTAEAALDRVAVDELFDLLDGRAAGFSHEFRIVLAVFAADVMVASVDGLCEMSGSVTALTGGNVLFLQNDHSAAALLQKRGCGKAGYSRTDDHYVSGLVAAQRGELRSVTRTFPER